MLHIEGLDHVVLTVGSIADTAAFYERDPDQNLIEVANYVDGGSQS
jgi:hypothetical protein